MILVSVSVDKCQRALDNIKVEKRKVHHKVKTLNDTLKNEKITKFFGLRTVAKYSLDACRCEVERVTSGGYLNPTEYSLHRGHTVGEEMELADAVRYLSGEETSLIVTTKVAKLISAWS